VSKGLVYTVDFFHLRMWNQVDGNSVNIAFLKMHNVDLVHAHIWAINYKIQYIYSPLRWGAVVWWCLKAC